MSVSGQYSDKNKGLVSGNKCIERCRTMKKKTIVLNNQAEMEKFVSLAEKINGNININAGDGVKLDASSLLGIFSVKHGSAMDVEYPETADDFEDYITTLEVKAAPLTFGY